MKFGDYSYGRDNIHIIWQKQGRDLTIGRYCSIATNLLVYLGGNHRTDWISTYPFFRLTNEIPEARTLEEEYEKSNGSVYIGNDVWIANNVTIHSGVSIGDGCVIASNSVVVKDCEPYGIYGGNPAKLVKKRFTDEQITELLKIKWWDWDINTVRANFRILSSNNIDEFIKIHKVN